MTELAAAAAAAYAVSRTANTFVNRFFDHIGADRQAERLRELNAVQTEGIVPRAKAETEAAVIFSKTGITITEDQAQSIRRLERESVRHTQNLNAIGLKSLPHYNEVIDPDAVPEGWMAEFTERCKNVSDEAVQELWAKLLAGEANAPGSFSRRALNVLSGMESSDAELFTKLCRTVWLFGNQPAPLIMPEIIRGDYYGKLGLSDPVLMHLEDLGLINFSSTQFQMLIDEEPWTGRMSYFGVEYEGLPTLPGVSFPVGRTLFTTSGRQLSRLSESGPIDGYPEFIASRMSIRPVGSSPTP